MLLLSILSVIFLAFVPLMIIGYHMSTRSCEVTFDLTKVIDFYMYLAALYSIFFGTKIIVPIAIVYFCMAWFSDYRDEKDAKNA